MTAGVVDRVDLWTRRATPTVSAALMVVFASVPWPLPAGVGSPMLGLVAVFFWTRHRPEWFGPLTAFLLGALQDILTDVPLGMTAMTFVIVHWIVRGQRRRFAGRSAVTGWVAFALLAALAAGLAWLLVSAYHLQMIAARPVTAELFVSVLLYPLAAFVLAGVDWLMIRRTGGDET